MLKKIWSTVTTVLVVAVMLLAVLLVGARLLGLQVFTVISGSMEPNYHVGSIIYVKPVDTQTLQKNDVISFVISENTVATHRIVEVIPDENDPGVIRFRTKGDANDNEDNNLVHSNNVLGKVVGTIPYLGYVSDFVQNPPGTYITVGAVAILMVAVFLPDFIPSPAAKEPEEPSETAADENAKLKAELESLQQKIQQQLEQKENNKKEVDENEENV